MEGIIVDIKVLFQSTLKKLHIKSFSLGFKEDWQQKIEWIVRENIEGEFYSFSYEDNMTVYFEVEKYLTEEELAYFYKLFEIILVQKRLNNKRNEIQKLQEGIQAIVFNVQADSLLENILQNAVDAIPAASTGILTVYNEQTKMLENVATVGFKKGILHAKFQIGEAIVGKIFDEGESKLFKNRVDINTYFNDVSEKNMALFAPEEKFNQTSGIIAVPIKLSEKTVGVILLQQQKNQWFFTDLDVKTIEHFASQMALAILNARIYNQLQERENFLSVRNDIHDRLISISLSDKGVPAIIKEVSSILHMNLLYYNFIYDKDIQQTTPKRDATFFETLLKIFQDHPVADYIELERKTFYVYPIVLEHTIVAIIVTEVNEDILETERMIIEQSAMMISIEILKKQSFMDRYLKRNLELFHRISSIPSTEAVQLLNQEVDYELNQPFCMIVIKVNMIKSTAPELELHKVITAIEKKLQDFEKFLFGANHQITIFVPLNNKSTLEQIRKNIARLLNSYDSFYKLTLYAGISNVHQDLSYLEKLTEEAQKACDYGEHSQNINPITFDSLGINKLFLTQPREYIEGFVYDIFDLLDQEKNDLSNTLRTYVSCQASPKKTADVLIIHINTLYQRLNKIEKILNLSLNDREEYLRIQLACYLYDHYPI